LVGDPLSKEELQQRALELLDLEGLEGPERCEAFLNAAKMIRYGDPKLMVAFAEYAADLADELDPEVYGLPVVVDCRCRTMIELGNAYRVADRLEDAGEALGEAADLWYQGSHDELVMARLVDCQASFYADRRQFALALAALDTIYSIYEQLGDTHRAGRALISKGIYRGYQGEQEEAIQLLEAGLAKIEPQLEPNLHFAGVQSQAYFLAILGRLRDARKLLWGNNFPTEVVEAPINRLKLLWVESVIEAGLGDPQRAEAGFQEVLRGFEKEKLYYNGALAGLELVHLWYRQGQMEKVREAVAGLVKIFQSYHVHREAFLALTLLEKAVERGIEAEVILNQVTDFVRRAEMQPELKFEDWFPS